tara:strand:- start:371 stop:2056 length:1686 start_codon:yes stop_codon:yes gene_type:complete
MQMKICIRCHRLYSAQQTHCEKDGAKLVLDRTKDVVQDRYILDKLIGTGSGGSSVWSSTDQSNDIRVALKFLPGRRSIDSNRFRRGASIAVRLDHPNIARVSDFGVLPNGDQFLVMELLYGYDLYQLSLVQLIPTERLFNILSQVLMGLSYAHASGVVHRDIKMSNIFVESPIDGPEVVKILDFGIARYIPGISNKEIGPVTGINQLVGTPQYMAPEQVKFLSLDGRVDLYSLGIMTYRILTGRFPYNGTAKEIFEQHLNTLLPNASGLRPSLRLDPELETWLSRALEKDRDKRFQTADEMRVELRRLQPAVTPRLEPISATEQPVIPTLSVDISETGHASIAHGRRWLSWMVMTLLAVLLLFLGGVFDGFDTSVSKRSASKRNASVAMQLDAGVSDVRRVVRSIVLSSIPSGATVSQNATVIGRTPLVVPVDPGRHDFNFRSDGYRPINETIIMGVDDEVLTKLIRFKNRSSAKNKRRRTQAKTARPQQEMKTKSRHSQKALRKKMPSIRSEPAGRKSVRPMSDGNGRIKIKVLDEVDERDVKLPLGPIEKDRSTIRLLD